MGGCSAEAEVGPTGLEQESEWRVSGPLNLSLRIWEAHRLGGIGSAGSRALGSVNLGALRSASSGGLGSTALRMAGWWRAGAGRGLADTGASECRLLMDLRLGSSGARTGKRHESLRVAGTGAGAGTDGRLAN